MSGPLRLVDASTVANKRLGELGLNQERSNWLVVWTGKEYKKLGRFLSVHLLNYGDYVDSRCLLG